MPLASRSARDSVAGSTCTGVGRLEAALDAVQPGCDQPADRQIGVAGRVGGLQLDVRRGLLHAGEHRRDPQRRLAVVDAPARERPGPVLGDDAVVGVEARRGQPAQTGQVLEHPGHERPRLGRQVARAGGIVEAVAVALPQREVDVAAVARVLRPRLRRQRGGQAMRGRDGADRLAHEQLLVDRGQGAARARSRSRAGRGRARRSTARARSSAPRARPPGRRSRPATSSCRWSRSTGCCRPARSRRPRPPARARTRSRTRPPCARRSSPRRSIMRARNERWQTGAGFPSRPIMSTSMAPVCGA